MFLFFPRLDPQMHRCAKSPLASSWLVAGRANSPTPCLHGNLSHQTYSVIHRSIFLRCSEAGPFTSPVMHNWTQPQYGVPTRSSQSCPLGLLGCFQYGTTKLPSGGTRKEQIPLLVGPRGMSIAAGTSLEGNAVFPSCSTVAAPVSRMPHYVCHAKRKRYIVGRPSHVYRF